MKKQLDIIRLWAKTAVRLTKKITLPLQKYVTTFIAIFFLFFIAYVLFVPKAYIAECFFGGIPKLYNVTLAEFFYKESLKYETSNGRPLPYTHYQLGRIYFIKGDLGRALTELNVEHDYYPDEKKYYYMRGLVLGYIGREKEAIDSFTTFIALTPETWAGRNDKAWLQFRIGDIDGALETIIPAITIDPANVWALNTYGTLLMNKGDYKEAKKAFEAGLTVLNTLPKERWGISYPGNDPRIYSVGIDSMKHSYENNLLLVKQKLGTVDK